MPEDGTILDTVKYKSARFMVQDGRNWDHTLLTAGAQRLVMQWGDQMAQFAQRLGSGGPDQAVVRRRLKHAGRIEVGANLMLWE